MMVDVRTFARYSNIAKDVRMVCVPILFNWTPNLFAPTDFTAVRR